MRLSILPLALVSVLFTPAHAADWFKLPGAEFVARLAVTIDNPADADHPAVLVTLPLVELGQAMPAASARTIALADESHEIVPFQIARLFRDHVLFVAPVKAKSSRTVYVYAAREPIALPTFAPMTGADAREAWRSFENDFSAFRIEIGENAKTTGLAIDVLGKTKAGHGAQLGNIYASDYHQRQPWGIDVLKVGTGPGLGGAYIFVGDEIGRTSALTTTFTIIYEGPVVTCVQASAPIEVAGRKFTLTRTITCMAGDRALHDEIEVAGENLADIRIGVGLRDLPDQTWVEKTDAGYCFVHGGGNQEGTEKLGLGVAFDRALYEKTRDIEDKANGGRIYLFTPTESRDGTAILNTRLAAFWDGDGWINNPRDFEQALAGYGRLCKSPAKVQVARSPQTR